MKTTLSSKNWRLNTFAVLGSVIAIAGVYAEPFVLHSGPKQVPVIELFSSEGCSSCPPADRWLGALETENGLWRDFVPVAFQVDYWDNLGWKDRFATKENTERQVRYSESGHSSNVYTPEFILNGTEWRSWGRVDDLPKRASADAGLLDVVGGETNRFQVTYYPPVGTHGDWDVTAAWVGSNLVSDVARGENSGRKLPHHFVVLKSGVFRLKPNEGKETTSFVFGPPTDAGKAKLAFVAWVSRREDQAPVLAVGGWWDRPSVSTVRP